MEEKNTKSKLYNTLIIIGCIVLAIAFSFGVKTMIDYKNNEYKEETYGDASNNCTDGGEYIVGATGSGPTCATCPAGSYCPEGSSGAVTCPAGSYCPLGSSSPTACSGTLFQDEAGQSACKVLSVSCSKSSIYTGGTTTCTAKVDGVTQSTGVTYTSSDGSKASVVSSTGVVTGNSSGSTTITASYSGARATTSISVTERPTVTVTCSPSSIYVGATSTCTTKVNGVTQSSGVTYTSSDGSKASVVSSTGVVTGNSVGSATITATYNGVSGTTGITVTERPTVTLTCTKTLLGSGETSTCTTKVNGVTQSNNVTYTSSKTSVASVSSSGLVSAINAGETIIKATYSGIESNAVTINVMLCSLGYWRGENSCEICPAGYYCADGLTKEACPTGKTSSIGAKSADDCYVKADDSECSVSVSIASKHVSIDDDGLNENSYYAVKVVVSGNGCNGQKLTYTATNAKSISPSSLSNISSGSTYYFNVYPKEACTSSTATATLTNGKKSSATISTILTDWKIENGCWTTAQVSGKPIGSHTADKEGVNEYYDDYDNVKQCYTVHAYRYGCGSSNPSTPSTEEDACYMNNSTGIYIWGKYKNDSNYTLISDKTSRDTCKPSEDGGYGDPIYACYKDENNNYVWAVTPPVGYTLIESIKDETNCKISDTAACYRDSDGKYKWGDYSNDNSYTLVEGIKTFENCNTPDACYKNANGEFVWGNYAYNSSYSLVANISNQSDCGDETVNVPSTGATTAAVIYVSVIIMLIAGGSFVYYTYNKKKLG